jgi:hypothetical protein
VDPTVAESGDQSQTARHVQGIEPRAQVDDLLGCSCRTELDGDRVDEASEKLHVSSVDVPDALSDPEKVPGGRLPARLRDPAHQGFL